MRFACANLFMIHELLFSDPCTVRKSFLPRTNSLAHPARNAKQELYSPQSWFWSLARRQTADGQHLLRERTASIKIGGSGLGIRKPLLDVIPAALSCKSPRCRSRFLRHLLAQVPGFAILSARLRTLVKQRSVCCSVGPGSRREGQREKHFRWKSQFQYRRG